MKYSVDRIENGIVIVENLETKEKKEIDKKLLPSTIHEGAILILIDNQYKMDEEEEQKRLTSLKEKFNKLRKR